MKHRLSRAGIAFLLALGPLPFLGSTPALATSAVGGLHVVGNHLVNDAGHSIHLRGVNRSGTEYMCIQDRGFFEGPSDLASIQAIASWHANVVRVPLNEDCWLGINGAPAAYSGSAYQQAISDYVSLLTSQGIASILELHWSAPGTDTATGQQPMADRDHSVAFWTEVANTFKSNDSVVFDPFNEPYPDANQDTTAAWQCWRDGGSCAGVGFMAAGMQELVDAVRGTGATNVIMLGGIGYANDMSRWLTYAPTDPLGNLVASWHAYNFNACTTLQCWQSEILPVASRVPLVAGEIGQDQCGAAFMNPLMTFLDLHAAGYLAWAWDVPFDCFSLVSDYTGTPTTPYGAAFHDHLAERAAFDSATLGDFTRIQNFAISRDGSTLAMAATLNGVAGLYETSRDGSNVVLLTREGAGYYAIDRPDFSPDDSRIAFTAFGNPGGGDVYTISPLGGSPANLTNSPFDEENPRYSPDGTTIVVASAEPYPNDSITEIRTVDTQTGNETLVLNTPYGVGLPTFSSDGSRILFSGGDGLGESQIWSMPAGGGSVTQLTYFPNGISASSPEASLAPSNTGEIIFYTAYTAIYTMDADGNSLAQTLTDPYSISDVHWTPEGTIAYLSTSFPGAHPHIHIPIVADLPPNGTLETLPGGPTATNPVGAAVTSPTGGTVTIEAGSPSTAAPPNYEFLDHQQVNISAPAATAEDPLILTFDIDGSLLSAAGLDETTVQVFRNSVLIGSCDVDATGASPDPCVAERIALPGGDAEVVVRTSHASEWDFGKSLPPQPPSVSISLNSQPNGNAGWFKTSPVQGSVSAAASQGATITSIDCNVATVPQGLGTSTAIATFSISTQGLTHLVCTATDSTGGTSTQATRDVKLDSIGPTLSPTISGVVLLNGSATASPNPNDATSGVASSSCPSVTTNQAGVQSIVCQATDVAGNSTNSVLTYVVQYKLLGFFSPAASSKWKSGQTVPVKIALSDAHGVRISDAQAKALLTPSCRVKFSASGAQSLAASCMKYDTANHQFVYSWKLGLTGKGSATIVVTVSYSGTSTSTVLSQSIQIM